jgi:hypothetical protein
MQVLSPAPIQVSISLLEKMPGILEQLLHDASPEVLQWKPAPERWSIQEVPAHLAVIEQLYSERVRRIVMEEDPAQSTSRLPKAKFSTRPLVSIWNISSPCAAHTSSCTPFPPRPPDARAATTRWGR